MNLVRPCVLLSLLACAVVQAQEALFIAHVERLTLEPRGGQSCPDMCAENGRLRPDGSRSVCMSNDGGCEKADLKIDRVLLGEMQAGPYSVANRIGEWGGTHFPVTAAPILVYMKPGLVEWAPVSRKNGQEMVRVKSFQHGRIINGIDLMALAKGDAESVPLETVIERVSRR